MAAAEVAAAGAPPLPTIANAPRPHQPLTFDLLTRDEVVVLDASELPDAEGDVIDLLTAEAAQPRKWLEVARAYLWTGRAAQAAAVLKEGSSDETVAEVREFFRGRVPDEELVADLVEMRCAVAALEIERAALAGSAAGGGGGGATAHERAERRRGHLQAALDAATHASTLAGGREMLPFLARGHVALAQGDARAALARYGEAAGRRHRGHATVAPLLAQAAVHLDRLSDPASALRLYRRALRANPRGCPPEVRLGMGACHHALGDLRRAAQCYERALELDPASADAMVGLAAVHFSSSSSASSGAEAAGGAAGGLGAGGVSEPTPLLGTAAEAEAARRRHALGSGLELLARAHAADPLHAGALAGLAHFALLKRQPGRALALARAALAATPDGGRGVGGAGGALGAAGGGLAGAGGGVPLVGASGAALRARAQLLAARALHALGRMAEARVAYQAAATGAAAAAATQQQQQGQQQRQHGAGQQQQQQQQPPSAAAAQAGGAAAALAHLGSAQAALASGDAAANVITALESAVEAASGAGAAGEGVAGDALRLLAQLLPLHPGRVTPRLLESYRSAARRRPGDASLWEALGELLAPTDPAGALRAYETALGVHRKRAARAQALIERPAAAKKAAAEAEAAAGGGASMDVDPPAAAAAAAALPPMQPYLVPSRLLNNAAVLYYRAGSVDEARALMTEASRNSAKEQQLQQQRRLLAQQQEGGAAAAAGPSSAAAGLQRVTMIYNLARVQEAAGDVRSAQDGYLRLLEQFPGHTDCALRMGSLARAAGDGDAAVAWARRAADAAAALSKGLDASDPAVAGALSAQADAQALLALARLDRGERQEAREAFERVRRLSEQAVRSGAAAAQRGGSRAAAEAAARAAEEFERAGGDAYAALGLANLELAEVAAAEQQQQAQAGGGGGGGGATRGPAAAAALAQLAARRARAVAEARALYISLLRSQPSNLYAANGLGVCLAEGGALDSARDAFVLVQEAAAASGGFVRALDAQVNLGHVHLARQEYPQAAAMYGNAARAAQGCDPEALLYLARAHFDARDLAAARLALRRAIRLSPGDPALRFDLALTLQEEFAQAARRRYADSDAARKAADLERALDALARARAMFADLRARHERAAAELSARAAALPAGADKDGAAAAAAVAGAEASRLRAHDLYCAEQEPKGRQELERARLDARLLAERREQRELALRAEEARRREEELVRQAAEDHRRREKEAAARAAMDALREKMGAWQQQDREREQDGGTAEKRKRRVAADDEEGDGGGEAGAEGGGEKRKRGRPKKGSSSKKDKRRAARGSDAEEEEEAGGTSGEEGGEEDAALLRKAGLASDDDEEEGGDGAGKKAAGGDDDEFDKLFGSDEDGDGNEEAGKEPAEQAAGGRLHRRDEGAAAAAAADDDHAAGLFDDDEDGGGGGTAAAAATAPAPGSAPRGRRNAALADSDDDDEAAAPAAAAPAAAAAAAADKGNGGDDGDDGDDALFD